MSGRLFWNLAWQNIRRNRQSYLPYALSCIGTVMMFFIIFVLANTATFRGIYGGRTLQMTLSFGVWVILLFALLFMFYTHSFLIKRRKKEFGLFNILGMEKKHIGRVLAMETALVGLFSTLAGALLGVLLVKLMFLVLLRVLGVQGLPPLAIPESALPLTLVVFLAIHSLTLLNTLREIHLSSPMSLLKGDSLGEREPRGRIWLTLIGILCLGAGYAISLTAKQVMDTIPLFFLAVILVILGTYTLFISGSITLLRGLRRNKAFYYQPRHFSVIAGMIHRMKRNAAGLATICILSTMVLVMVSTTITIFAASENFQSKVLMDRDALLSVRPLNEEMAAQAKAALLEEAEKSGVPVNKLSIYRKALIQLNLGQQPGTEEALTDIYLVPLEDYQVLSKSSLSLAPGEALSHSTYGDPLPQQMSLGNQALKLRENLKTIAPLEEYAHMMQPTYTLIMNRRDIALVMRDVLGLSEGEIPWEWVFSFDTGTGLSVDQVEPFFSRVRERIVNLNSEGRLSMSTQHWASLQADFRAVYGGLLFVAVFLGLVFIMAMVLIIYYKQVSEGYEDKARFDIMQKVGMSDQEVRQTVKSQVLLVFFIPLVMAGIHLLAAYNIISKIMIFTGMLINRTGLVAMVSLITYVCFALFYVLVYAKTSNSYYKIVKA